MLPHRIAASQPGVGCLPVSPEAADWLMALLAKGDAANLFPSTIFGPLDGQGPVMHEKGNQCRASIESVSQGA